MNADIVKIGNSKGIRIPAYILRECNIKDKVEMQIKEGKIIIKAIDKPRNNWDDKFRAMSKNADDELIIDDTLGLDAEEWEW